MDVVLIEELTLTGPDAGAVYENVIGAAGFVPVMTCPGARVLGRPVNVTSPVTLL